MAGETIQETGDIFQTTGHQIVEMGIVFSMFLVAVIILVAVIRRLYQDGRTDRAELVSSYKQNADAMNNLAKQMEIANAQKNPCLFRSG